MSQIYKLFYNNRMLQLIDDTENMNLCKNEKLHIYSNPADLIITIRTFEKDMSIQTLYVQAKNKIGEVLEVIKSMYEYVSAAGGIVVNSKNELLFIHRFNKWDLPKGHVERNESIEKAAVREVIEETAVKGLTMGKYLGSTFHVYFLFNRWCVKETHYYKMFTSSNAPLIPQLSEAIEEAKWVPLSDVANILDKSYTSIKVFVLDHSEELLN